MTQISLGGVAVLALVVIAMVSFITWLFQR